MIVRRFILPDHHHHHMSQKQDEDDLEEYRERINEIIERERDVLDRLDD